MSKKIERHVVMELLCPSSVEFPCFDKEELTTLLNDICTVSSTFMIEVFMCDIELLIDVGFEWYCQQFYNVIQAHTTGSVLLYKENRTS